MNPSAKTNGAYLNTLWGVGAAHALYIYDGHWYHPLKRFPGALFDRHGYLLFATEEEYRTCPHLSIGKQISVRKPGISAIPGYVRVAPENEAASPFAPPVLDVDIHGSIAALEGRRRLVVHLERERNQSVVRKKKRSAASLSCEVCGFSFERAYGSATADYCEVHHVVPLFKVEETTETRLEALPSCAPTVIESSTYKLPRTICRKSGGCRTAKQVRPNKGLPPDAPKTRAGEGWRYPFRTATINHRRERCTSNSSAPSGRSKQSPSHTQSGIALGCDGCMAVDGGASGRELQPFVSPMDSYAKPKSIGMRRLELVEES